MKSWHYAVFLILSLGAAAYLFFATGYASPQERVVARAFAAIQKNDLDAYAELTVTMADFEMLKNKINVFGEGLTYAGKVVKPEEQERQREEFEKAVTGGPGIIDFKKARFVGLSDKVKRGAREMLSGGEVPYEVYSVIIELDGRRIDTGGMRPRFVVVEYYDDYSILGLSFKD